MDKKRRKRRQKCELRRINDCFDYGGMVTSMIGSYTQPFYHYG